MKIAYVCGAFVSRWVKRGVEKRIYEISKRLVERGYEVHWFGFAQASRDYIVMGDADNTYDFMGIPRLLEPMKIGIGHRLTMIDTDLK